MTLISRRGLLAGAAGLGARRKRRCVAMYPDNPGEVLALLVVVQGDNGGVFLYDAAGHLVDSMAVLADVDPNTASNLPGIENINPANGTFVQLNNGQVIVGLNGASVLNAQVISAAAAQIATAVGASLAIIVNGSLMQLISPQVWVSASGGAPATSALFEVNGPMAVIGAAPSELAFIKQTGTAGHALTVFLDASGGNSQAALNVVSINSAFSCLEVTGTETNRGTVKITHQGYSDGSDSSAAAVSIDLQTTVGGSGGTAAQGIFITSTTDAIPAGNALTVRYGSQDWFVVKGNTGAGAGIVGIGVATGHTPAGMLEIVQKDTATIGVAMTAIAAGTDMINLKDSGGNQRFQVNNAGNLVTRANAFFLTNAIIGSVTSDFGGAGSALTICHTTDPSTNPASGHVIIYADAAGNLLARTSAGNVRTIAAV